jgi:hypothetical protein
MKTTISLRVENHTCDHDVTYAYIDAANWTAPEGVAYDRDAGTLTGETDAVWAAYKSLAAMVADAGHGDADIDGEPILSACPVELIDESSGGAAECLARMMSPDCDTWAEFVAAVPSLATA